MRTFSRIGERVLVRVCEESGVLRTCADLHGEVTRICSDGRAWIRLDTKKGHRLSNKKVRAAPENCAVCDETSAGRRRAAREASRPDVTPDLFGRDHHSTLLYIESCCVDQGGRVNREHMRCDRERHPLRAHLEGKCSSTRLADGKLLAQHDDWDCVEDMIACGWMVETGSTMEPRFMLTGDGWGAAQLLRREKAQRAQPTALVEPCADPSTSDASRLTAESP